MEPPVSLDRQDIRDEKVKVLNSIRKVDLEDRHGAYDEELPCPNTVAAPETCRKHKADMLLSSQEGSLSIHMYSSLYCLLKVCLHLMPINFMGHTCSTMKNMEMQTCGMQRFSMVALLKSILDAAICAFIKTDITCCAS